MAKYTLPPRQKMINLLYVVLIAMLAINISSDVLEGYGLMNNDYLPQIEQLEEYNRTLLERINNSRNDQATLSAQSIDATAGKLMGTLEGLKEDIARKADKEKYETGKLKAKDDLKNESHRKLVGTYLDTQGPGTGISWEKETFSYLPAIGGVTFINKIQEEVLLCVNEVYRSLLYEEAEDGKSGTFVFINEDQMIVNRDGTVDLPVVQITPALTNILYTNYENPLNILTAGIPFNEVTFSMTNGKIIKRGNNCLAIPDEKARTATVTATKTRNGETKRLAEYQYTVKALPDPTPYVLYKDESGKTVQYRGNVPINKKSVYNMTQIGASISDGPKAEYKVVSFEMVLIKGNGKAVTSIPNNGNRFSTGQMELIRQLDKGDKFYITSIVVAGPGNKKKQIASINVVLI